MSDYVVSDSSLQSVANAIRTKGGTSDPLAYPAGFVSAIQAIPSGGGSVTEKDVNFIDYDGAIVASYTAQEAQALTELPANPTHAGLTSQGWNWTLAQIKSQLTNVGGKVWVGQMYITTSGDTEIDIVLDDPELLSPYLAVAVDGEIDIDWGDGTTHNTMTGDDPGTVLFQLHEYASTGSYTIKIHVNSGGLYFRSESSSVSVLTMQDNSTNRTQSRAYSAKVRYIRLGQSTYFNTYAIQYCCNLKSITIPFGVTSIASNAFSKCYSLQSITIPNSVTSIMGSAFLNCYSLQSIAIPNSVSSLGSGVFTDCRSLLRIALPNSVTSIGTGMFSNCSLLQNVTIPNSITSIGSSMFSGCYTLQNVTIPNGVTSVGNSAFSSCYSLQSITLPNSVTSLGTSVFSACYSLQSVVISSQLAAISSSTFSNCESLLNVVIPSNVTRIWATAFSACYSLHSISIPSSVTRIGANTFANCYGIVEYHMERTTPPTLDNINAFTGIAAGTIIYVPYSADHSILNDYKTADNWSTYASYMQEEPAP